MAEAATSRDVVPVGTAEEKKEEVAAIDPEMLIKHPLENKWALWYFKNDRTRDWNENLKLVTEFEFVEDFWA